MRRRPDARVLYFDRYVLVCIGLLLLALLGVAGLLILPPPRQESFSPLFAVAVWALPLGVASSSTFNRKGAPDLGEAYSFSWKTRTLFWTVVVAAVFSTLGFAYESKGVAVSALAATSVSIQALYLQWRRGLAFERQTGSRLAWSSNKTWEPFRLS